MSDKIDTRWIARMSDAELRAAGEVLEAEFLETGAGAVLLGPVMVEGWRRFRKSVGRSEGPTVGRAETAAPATTAECVACGGSLRLGIAIQPAQPGYVLCGPLGIRGCWKCSECGRSVTRPTARTKSAREKAAEWIAKMRGGEE